ncbi:MAG: hypothetical protein MRY57_01825 [Candidatus Pacebacteria bacterium]|nr:hypothetical protein [Candidatus Paceibacterota bacterium]
MQILQVTPIARSMTTEVLTYFSAKTVSPGMLVTVPLRKQQVKALVINVETVTNMKTLLKGADYQIRNVLEIHNEQVFSSAYLTTCRKIAKFYTSNTGKIVNLITPSFILKDIGNFNRPIQKQHSGNYKTLLLQRNQQARFDYYKTLLREKKLQSESIHIICPTIEHAIKIYGQLQKNNTGYVFLLHSKLTKKQLTKEFENLHVRKESSCIISTPGFIDSHQINKKLLIIEDEHSPYYRTVGAPMVDMRVMARLYAKENTIQCIIAGSVLSPESWLLQKETQTELIEPFDKKIFKGAEIVIENLHQKKPGKQTDTERHKELTKSKAFACLSESSIKTIKTAVKEKKKIFIYSHKKSLAPNIICKHCGNLARSPESGLPYSLYIKQNKQTRIKERIFICQNTGEKIPAFDICQFCKGHHLMSYGIGTERIYEELKQEFPKTLIQIIDGVHTKTQKKLKETLDSHHLSKKASIIIGTQKALPYIKNTDISIISSLDSYFSRMSYSISSDLIHLIKKITENTVEQTIIQSRNILEDLLPILRNGIYSEYIEQELKERKEYGYPPHENLITITKTIDAGSTKKYYYEYLKLFEKYNPQILIYPGSKKGKVILTIILQVTKDLWSEEHQDPDLYQLLTALGRGISISVNPKNIIS